MCSCSWVSHRTQVFLFGLLVSSWLGCKLCIVENDTALPSPSCFRSCCWRLKYLCKTSDVCMEVCAVNNNAAAAAQHLVTAMAWFYTVAMHDHSLGNAWCRLLWSQFCVPVGTSGCVYQWFLRKSKKVAASVFAAILAYLFSVENIGLVKQLLRKVSAMKIHLLLLLMCILT